MPMEALTRAQVGAWARFLRSMTQSEEDYPLTDEPRLQAEPREGVPDVIDTLPAFREYCSALASSHGSLAADAERASGFRYGHDDWLVQFKETVPA